MIDLKQNQNIKELYLPEVKSATQYLYCLLLFGVIAAITSLPLIKFDIAVKSMGVVRPSQERTEIKAPVSAIIENVYFREGELVEKGALLFRLKNDNAALQNSLQTIEIDQRIQNIHDLELLCSASTKIKPSQLSSPIYRQQLDRLNYQLAERRSGLKKIEREYHDNLKLKEAKVISDYELLEKRTEYEQQTALCNSIVNEQRGLWAEQLVQNKLELANFQSQQKQLSNNNNLYEIRAPIKGTLQGINTRYMGNAAMAGESLCVLSPNDSLIAECLVPTQDIGLLRTGQKVRFQIDAFDYNYFGIITGTVKSIDNDFTIHENKPFFKVRCSFDTTQIMLKNGFTGKLKKGLTFQARFMVARRSLWQLLFDKIDDWLNPIAPDKNANN